MQQVVIANQSSSTRRQVVCGGGAPLMLIAGPCQIESLDHALVCAERLKTMAAQAGMGFVYKSSYDKANRTSAMTARGVGIDAGLDILAQNAYLNDVRSKNGKKKVRRPGIEPGSRPSCTLLAGTYATTIPAAY